jgi:hypothetical protein
MAGTINVHGFRTATSPPSGGLGDTLDPGGYLRPISRTAYSPPWVVLDSTVVSGRDRYLESAAGRLLRDEAAAGSLRIAVPEVVVIEAGADQRRAVQAARERLVAAHEPLRTLSEYHARDLRPWRLHYREDLQRVLAEVGGEILPIPDVPHEHLQKRAGARRRPFDAEGHGYRRALVWESVLALLAREPEPVVLISADHAAFSQTRDEPELAADLAAELRERGNEGRVALCFGLGEFVAETPRVRELASRWRQSLADRPELGRALTQKLLEVTNAQAGAVIAGDLPLDRVRQPRFFTFTRPRGLHVDEAWVSPTGISLLDVSLTVDYTLEFDIPTSAAPAFETEWTSVRSSSTLVLSFEVIQHHSTDEPNEFGARLVGWSDPRDS